MVYDKYTSNHQLICKTDLTKNILLASVKARIYFDGI